MAQMKNRKAATNFALEYALSKYLCVSSVHSRFWNLSAMVPRNLQFMVPCIGPSSAATMLANCWKYCY